MAAPIWGEGSIRWVSVVAELSVKKAVLVEDITQAECITRRVASAIATKSVCPVNVYVATLRSVTTISVALYVIAEAVVAASFMTARSRWTKTGRLNVKLRD